MEEKVLNRQKVSIYSAFLALLVVLLHAENTHLYGGAAKDFNSILQWVVSENIARIAVPSFFMLSGILFFRDFSMEKYPKKLHSRTISLFVPYLVWNTLRLLYVFLLGKAGLSSPVTLSLQNIVEGIFFYKYNLGFWFMYQLILFCLISPFIRLCVKNKFIAFLLLLLFVGLYSADVFPLSFGDVPFIQPESFVYFYFGAICGTHLFDNLNKKSNTLLLPVAGIILGQVLFVLFLVRQSLFLNIASIFISCASFWYAFDYIKFKEGSFRLSSITFFIYAFHGTVLEILQSALSRLLPEGAFASFAAYLTVPAITVLIIYGVSVFLKKYTPPLWKVLNGAR